MEKRLPSNHIKSKTFSYIDSLLRKYKDYWLDINKKEYMKKRVSRECEEARNRDFPF